jgi:hypothetical protein
MTEIERKAEMNRKAEAFKESLALRRELLMVLESLVEQITTTTLPESVEPRISTYGIEFHIKDLKGLKAIRRFSKSLWPGYKDKLTYVGATYDAKGYASYEMKTGIASVDKYDLLKVILTAPIESWPLKHKAGCGFKKTQVVNNFESWSYSCDQK